MPDPALSAPIVEVFEASDHVLSDAVQAVAADPPLLDAVPAQTVDTQSDHVSEAIEEAVDSGEAAQRAIINNVHGNAADPPPVADHGGVDADG